MSALATRFIHPGALVLDCVVSPDVQRLLVPVIDELRKQNPKAVDVQMVDVIFEAGVRHLWVQLGLPRPDSNPDEDA